MLGNLMKKTENADLKRRFGEFFSREGKELYREMLDKQVIFVDLLVAFPLLKPPVSVLAYLKRQEYLFAIKNAEFFRIFFYLFFAIFFLQKLVFFFKIAASLVFNRKLDRLFKIS